MSFRELCTPSLCLRLLGAVLNLSGFIVTLAATGADEECKDTNYGPGSEICPPVYPYNAFSSCIFYVVIAFFSFLWCTLMILAHVFQNRPQPIFCQKYGERIEYISDFFAGGLNLLAYMLMIFELNGSQPDRNQGKTIMELAGDKDKYAAAAALAFISFTLSNINIVYNLKVVTKSKYGGQSTNAPPGAETQL